MVKKILKILQEFFYSMALINLGILIVFIFYGRHLCCDKGSDWIIYMIISIISFVLTIIFELISDIKGE